jgi:hypothetical protein
MLDVVEHAANTLDSKGVAATVALEAALVTQMALWDAAGAGDSSAVYATALTALAALRTAAVSAAAASITNYTANDFLDGRAG